MEEERKRFIFVYGTEPARETLRELIPLHEPMQIVTLKNKHDKKTRIATLGDLKITESGILKKLTKIAANGKQTWRQVCAEHLLQNHSVCMTSWDAILKHKLRSAKVSSKTCTITYRELFSKLIFQEYKCFYTGIAFKKQGGQLFTPSIERLDEAKGYTDINTVLVCEGCQIGSHNKESPAQWSKAKAKYFAECRDGIKPPVQIDFRPTPRKKSVIRPKARNGQDFCNFCNEWKAAANFSGRKSICKPCKNARCTDTPAQISQNDIVCYASESKETRPRVQVLGCGSRRHQEQGSQRCVPQKLGDMPRREVCSQWRAVGLGCPLALPSQP